MATGRVTCAVCSGTGLVTVAAGITMSGQPAGGFEDTCATCHGTGTGHRQLQVVTRLHYILSREQQQDYDSGDDRLLDLVRDVWRADALRLAHKCQHDIEVYTRDDILIDVIEYEPEEEEE